MNKTLQTLLCAAGIALAQHAAAYDAVTNERLLKPEPQNWLMYRGTYNGHGYSPLDKINKNNVKNLRTAWTWAMSPGATEITPIVHDGVLFLFNYADKIQALDATNGDLLWEFKRPANGRPGRTMAIFEDMIIYGAPDSAIVAVDARTGKLQRHPRRDVR